MLVIKTKNILATLTAIAMLTSCATMNKNECQTADWHSVGVTDGTKGKLPNYLSSHASACKEYNIIPNRAEWLKGRKEGLKEYCSVSNAYQLGLKGNDLNSVCGWLPLAQQQLIRGEHKKGKLFFVTKKEVASLQKQLKAEKTQLEDVYKKVTLVTNLKGKATATYPNPSMELYRLVRQEGKLEESIRSKQSRLEQLKFKLRQY